MYSVNYTNSAKKDLMKLPKKTLVELVLAGGQNCWSIQNNWMEYMYSKYGNQAAGDADENVFYKFSRSLIYRERRILGIEGNDVDTLMQVFRYGSMLDGDGMSMTKVSDTKLVIQIDSCTMGTMRRKTGRPMLPCKPAGFNYFKAVAQMVNPKAKVTCIFCPPDEIPKNVMCKWEIKFPAS